MSDELKNKNTELSFGDEPEKNELAVAGDKAIKDTETESGVAVTEEQEVSLEEVLHDETELSEKKTFSKVKKLEKGTVTAGQEISPGLASGRQRG